jgi:Secretion system C-terminal sorting domain
MKKINLLFSILMGVFSPIFSQASFEKTFGSPGGTEQIFNKIIALPDGGYLLAGNREKPESRIRETWVVRTDSQHAILWEKSFGDNLMQDIARSSDGNFFLMGQTSDNTGLLFSNWVIKFTSDGTQIWKKTFPPSVLLFGKIAIAATSDGGFVTTGAEENLPVSVEKFDENGVQKWTINPISGPDFGRPGGILALASGNIIYFGAHQNQFTAVKMSAAGTIIWLKTYANELASPVTFQDEAYSMVETPNAGGFLLLGRELGNSKNIITKIDSLGMILWQTDGTTNGTLTANQVNFAELQNGNFVGSYSNHIQIIGTDGVQIQLLSVPNSFMFANAITDMAVNNLGNIVLSGLETNSGDGKDALLLELSSTLSEIKHKPYGDLLPNSTENGWSVQNTTDGGFLCAGNKYFTDRKTDFYLFKTDGNGVVQWENNFGTELAELCFSAKKTFDDGILLVGRQVQLNNRSSLLLLKTDATGNKLWEKKYDYRGVSNNMYSIELADHSQLIFYRGRRFLSEDTYAGVMKIDANGDSLWTKIYPNGNSFRSANLNNTGNIITNGIPKLNGTGWILELDADGKVLLETVLGGTNNFGFGYSIEQLANTEYLASGVLNNGGVSDSIYLTKLSSNGTLIEEKIFNPTSSFHRRPRLDKTTDGNFVISTTIDNDSTNSGNVLLIKVNPNGDQLWLKQLGKYQSSVLFDSEPTPDGGLIAFGITENKGSSDFYLLKTLADGSVSAFQIQPLGNLQISPNPSSGPLAIQFENDIFGKIEVAIFDGKGQLIHSIFETKTDSIFQKNYQLDAISSGAYFVRLTQNGRIVSRSWLKN